MSVVSGPNVSKPGMIACLDAGNPKSMAYRPDSSEHGISEWACMESGTATGSAIYPGTNIYRLDSNQNSTLVLTNNLSQPSRFNLSVTAGNTYWADRPIHLLVEGAGSYLVPLSLKGRTFGRYNDRYGDSNFFFYPLYETATIQIFDNTPNGINDTPTTTITVPARTVGTWSTATEPGFAYFVSDTDIVMTGRDTPDAATNADYAIMPPASNAIYKRPAASAYTLSGASVSPATSTSYYIADPTNLCFAQNIGDGDGGDSAFGVPLENLSDTYTWGNVVSDYQIVSPYDNVITSYYWDGLSGWTQWDSHNLTGTLTNPGTAFRTGTDGPGVESSQSLDLGGTTVMVGSGANQWLWEGTAPFYLIINDTVADEEPLFGWMANKTQDYTYNTDKTFGEISGTSISLGNASIENSYISKNIGDVQEAYIQLVDSNSKIDLPTYDIGSNGISVEMIYRASLSDNFESGVYSRMFDYADTTISLGNVTSGSLPVAYTLRAWTDGGGSRSTEFRIEPSISPRFFDNYHHLVITYDKSSFTCYWNVDTTTTTSETGDLDVSASSYMTIGNENGRGSFFPGRIPLTRVYNKALTQEEVETNFYSLKSRYNLERF